MNILKLYNLMLADRHLTYNNAFCRKNVIYTKKCDENVVFLNSEQKCV